MVSRPLNESQLGEMVINRGLDIVNNDATALDLNVSNLNLDVPETASYSGIVTASTRKDIAGQFSDWLGIGVSISAWNWLLEKLIDRLFVTPPAPAPAPACLETEKQDLWNEEEGSLEMRPPLRTILHCSTNCSPLSNM